MEKLEWLNRVPHGIVTNTSSPSLKLSISKANISVIVALTKHFNFSSKHPSGVDYHSNWPVQISSNNHLFGSSDEFNSPSFSPLSPDPSHLIYPSTRHAALGNDLLYLCFQRQSAVRLSALHEVMILVPTIILQDALVMKNGYCINTSERHSNHPALRAQVPTCMSRELVMHVCWNKYMKRRTICGLVCVSDVFLLHSPNHLQPRPQVINC